MRNNDRGTALGKGKHISTEEYKTRAESETFIRTVNANPGLTFIRRSLMAPVPAGQGRIVQFHEVRRLNVIETDRNMEVQPL